MKKSVLFFGLFLLLAVSTLYSQSLDDYVDSRSADGDTLVIKDYVDMSEPSTLRSAIIADTTDVPEGRVYELKVNGYYPLLSNITTPSSRKIVIAGADDRRLVANDDETSAPPLICGFSSEDASNTGAIYYLNDLTVKNISIVPSTASAYLGWSFFATSDDSVKLELENDMFEHTQWVFMNNDYDDIVTHIKDCYFVNLNGNDCRRNGGVYDQFGNPDSLIVENSTHVMGQGMQYKFRNYPFEKIIFNHNTFVNISSYVFENFGYQSNMSITNNIFVNCNIQPYMTGIDADEADQDQLPMGIINVRDLPSTLTQVDRKILVQDNLAYWSDAMSDVVSTVIANKVNNSEDWTSQMITMNSRSQSMFDDDTNYPYLTEDDWYSEAPNFTDAQDLMTDQVTVLHDFSISTVDTVSSGTMADWRLVNIGSDYYIYSDWPIPVDLSYDNETLVAGGIGGFPIGDLNWFPSQKEAWLAQRSTEYATIESALQSGELVVTGVEDENSAVKQSFELQQNYPNPFNPTTTIAFTIPEAGNVTLKVYNALGQEVATLVNEYKAASSYSINFNATHLASGVYIYSLKYGNNSITKKMMLLK